MLNPTERGEMMVVQHGRREMQLAWTHLLPATFSGRARMNVQNSLAAAAAAFAAGAPLHDIRQGLRTFSTNYYLSPGRLNEVEVNGVNVIVDYCHNAPGMKMLGDFVDRVGDSLESSHDLARPSRIGIIATAGDRRDQDMRELGQIAAQHFDVCIVREDVALRGRERGATAQLVLDGVRAAMDEGARCKQAELVLEEIEAVRHAMSRANRGDLVVVCVDKHAEVMAELENWSDVAQAGSATNPDAPSADPDYTPRADQAGGRRVRILDPDGAARTVRSRRTGAAASPVGAFGLSADAHLVAVTLAPGGVIGRHPAIGRQLLVVLVGRGRGGRGGGTRYAGSSPDRPPSGSPARCTRPGRAGGHVGAHRRGRPRHRCARRAGGPGRRLNPAGRCVEEWSLGDWASRLGHRSGSPVQPPAPSARATSGLSGVPPCAAIQSYASCRSAWHIRPTTSPGSARSTRAARQATSVV